MRKYEKKEYHFLVGLFVLFLTACSSESTFERNVENGDYTKAITEYTDRIAGNSSKESEAVDFLRKYISQNIEKYARGEITDEEMQSIVDCYLKIDNELYLLNTELGAFIEEFSSIQASRESYNKAIEALDNKKYEEAIRNFNGVNEVDVLDYNSALEKLTDAQTKYFSELLAESEPLIEKNNYSEAYEHFTDAFEALQSLEDYQTQYQKLKEEWVVYAIAEAEKAFENQKDYESAIKILQQITFTDARIDSEMAKYQEYIPINLTELDYVRKAEYIQIGAYSDDSKDVNGTTYNSESVICPCGGYLYSDVATTDDEASVVYYLNSKYSTLTGILYRPYSSLSSTEKWENPSTVKIYGDDVLLYEAPNITQDTYNAISIKIDITGVRELKIVMRGLWNGPSGWVGMYDRNPKVCLGDLKLQK